MTLLFTSLVAVELTLLSAFVDIKLAEAGNYFAYSNSSSFMRLSLGFNLSIGSSYNITGPMNTDVLGVQNLDDSLFYPILSSPSFNSSQTGGFSLGFYNWCKLSYDSDDPPCYVYMAVCAGSSGNMTDLGVGMYSSFNGLMALSTANGFAVPVWFANLHHPIENALNASLVVVAADDVNHNKDVLELQLRDGNKVVWNVSNAGLMEVSDNGYFSIYHSANLAATSSSPVFQSAYMDTLVEGQKLLAGMQLASNDSAYSAKMEKGGLVLLLNSLGPQAPPYWIFPFVRESSSLINLTLNQAIFSAPCDNPRELPYLQPDDTSSESKLIFSSGRCRRSANVSFSSEFDEIGSLSILWSFVRLERDGRLYFYSVLNSSSRRTSVKYALSSDNLFLDIPGEPNTHPSLIMQNVGTDCDVPLACGPLGICTPNVQSICACPNASYFVPIDDNYLSLGCKPLTPLPSCSNTIDQAGANSGRRTNSSTPALSFVELKSTANIFLFTGWMLPNNSSTVDGCKMACSLDCSCYGVSYQVSTFSCFLITQNISLLHVSDFNASSMPLTLINSTYKEIFADDYVTHLKVVPQHESAAKVPTMTTLVGILFVCLVVSFLLGLGGYHLRKRRRELRQQAKEDEELKEVLPLLPTRFSYKELHAATKGFSKLVGKGGCGSVYDGALLDGRRVAVKVLEGMLQGARQTKEFLAEVAAAGRAGHHNVVRLVGYCWQVSHRILVYEYVERGSLDLLLFNHVSKEKSMLLDWEKRYNVALGIARGLHYLHEECEQPILHFDIKPQNILLNDAFVAKIADFGMSRLLQRDRAESTTVTNLRGTIGYIAPEWLACATASKKCDIYSFGIVMLEIVAGRKVLDSLLNKGSCSDHTAGVPVEQEIWHLPTWVAKKREQGCLMDIVDPRLRVCGFDEVQAQRLLYTALWCVDEDPAMRPTAATIVKWLESSLPVQAPPVSSPSA